MKTSIPKLALALLLAWPPMAARAAGVAGMFSQGNASFMIEAGGGTAYNNSYTILGVGAHYFVMDGLAVGLSYESWSGASPGITQVTPSVLYVFYDAPYIKPYLGGFYRHTSVSGRTGFNSAGIRAGGYIHAGRHTAIGVGVVAENYMNCQRAFGPCSQAYPEISLIFSF
ncbi:MAG TPA: hypothetical protein VIU46_03500 [Gallionellaceae bacterium]